MIQQHVDDDSSLPRLGPHTALFPLEALEH